MKQFVTIRSVCVLVALAMLFAMVGCNAAGKGDGHSSETLVSSAESTVSDTKDGESVEDSSASNDQTDQAREDTEEGGEDITETETPSDTTDDAYVNTVFVNNASDPVNTDFLGINGIYHAYTYMSDKYDREYTEKQAQMEFDRIERLGVNNVRSYYNTEFAWDTQTNSWDWESDSMQAIYRWMKEMEKRDITISLNAGWGLAGLYDANYWAPWKGVYVDGDLDATTKNYTQWMIESLKQLRAHGVNNVEYLIMFTEPSAMRWETFLEKGAAASRDMEPNLDHWLRCTKALDAALKQAGLRSDYLMVGPNDHNRAGNPDGTYMTPLFYHSVMESADYMDIFSCHCYFDLSDITTDVVPEIYDLYLGDRIELVKNQTNKRFWIDETNVRTSGSLNNANETISSPWHAMQWGTLLNKVMHSGVQNVIMWALADQQWPNSVTYNNDSFVNGIQRSGLLPTLFESSLPRASYYGTSLLTRYFGNHATVYESYCMAFGFYTGAQQDADGNWSLFVTNMNVDDDATISFAFEKSIGKQTFYRHLYEITDSYATASANIIGVDKVITTSGDEFFDEIPAGCLAVYTTIKD